MEEVAKLLVLAVFVALLMAYIKRGPEGSKEWLRAKGLGQVNG